MTTSAGPLSAPQRRILAIVLVPLFMSLLSVSIVNVVLPSVQTSIGASASALQWILTGYTLAFGIVLVPAGRAGDLYGRAPMFVIGVGLFGVGSLAAGLAPDALLLNIARLLMGLGSGFLNPQTIGFIQQYFQGVQRGRAFGYFGSVVGVAVAIGPLLGGGLIELFGEDWGWRAAFLINVPIALCAIATAVVWLPRSAWRSLDGADEADRADEASASDHARLGNRPRGGAGRRRPDVDPVGVVLLGFATLLIMIPFVEGGVSPWFWLLLLVGVVLLVAWVRWENRYKARGGAPMVDMALFRTRSFSSGALLIGLYFTGMPAVWVIIAVMAQSGMGYSALQAGLLGLPSAICSAISAAIAGRLVVRVGRVLVVGGMAVMLTGLLASVSVMVLHQTHGLSIWWVLATMAVAGMGQGCVVSPNQTLSLADVPLRHAGAAGGVMQTGQRIGTAVGIAAITAVFFAAQAASGWTAALVWAFVPVTVMVVAALGVGIADLVLSRRAPGSSSG